MDRPLDSYDVERRAVVVGSVSRYTDFITRAVLETPAPVRAVGLLAWRLALRVPPVQTLRDLLDGRSGWILVRPDAHVAWARDDLEGIGEGVRHALGAR